MHELHKTQGLNSSSGTFLFTIKEFRWATKIGLRLD